MDKTITVETIRALADLILEAKATVFFGGAGVSTASGVPDFRSAQGIYQQHRHAEEMLTPRFMQQSSETFYEFYRKYFILEGIKPNACHLALAELERRGLLQAIITQNVDHLHQDAGSRKVIELHGSGNLFYCMRCRKEYPVEDVRTMPLVPLCSCGGMLRPDIVLYEEGLPDRAIRDAVRAIENADLLIVGGTSLAVYPAAGLINYLPQHAKKVLIDLSAQLSSGADLTIRAPIADVFTALMQELDAAAAEKK